VVVPRVLWVVEKEGVLGMEMVEGWSVREILGGGAEGEVEIEADDGEEELEHGIHNLEIDETGSEDSEGWIALREAGVTQGENCLDLCWYGVDAFRSSDGGYRGCPSEITRHRYHTWRSDYEQYDDSSYACQSRSV
jgi:hypothetical protein